MEVIDWDWSHINRKLPYGEMRDELDVIRDLRWAPNSGSLEEAKHEKPQNSFMSLLEEVWKEDGSGG